MLAATPWVSSRAVFPLNASANPQRSGIQRQRHTHGQSQNRRTKVAEGAPAKAPTVAGLRSKIDHLDRELVALINQRAKLAHKIGQIKEYLGSANLRSRCAKKKCCPREHAQQRPACATPACGPCFARSSAARERWKRQCAWPILGPAYSYSHLAAIASLWAGGRFGAGRDDCGRVRGSAIAGKPISASCRSKTPPTAASPTRSTCSPACR